MDADGRITYVEAREIARKCERLLEFFPECEVGDVEWKSLRFLSFSTKPEVFVRNVKLVGQAYVEELLK